MFKYLVYYKKLFKTNMAYKSNFFFEQILDVVFFVTFFYLWKNVYQGSGLQSVGGYDLSALVTYYFATELIFRFDVIGAIYLNWDVWDGYFTNWVIKPINLTYLYIIDPIVEKTFVVLMAVPTFLFSWLIAKDYIVFPAIPNIVFFIATVLLAFLLNIIINLCIHALVFRLGDQDSNIELANYIMWFLAGSFFPLSFLPNALEKIMTYLPFQYLMYVPANVFLGKYEPQQILISWIIMIGWMCVFAFIYKKIYNNGIKYYTGVGR